MNFYGSKNAVKFLNYDQLLQLMKIVKDCANFRDYIIFQISYYAGLRASEVGLIKPEYINFRAKTMYCERLKGSHSNTIVLDDFRLKLLKKYLDCSFFPDYRPMFVSNRGVPISRYTLDWAFKKYGKLAKIPVSKRHFHVLKHSIAVHMLESGVNLRDVQAHLGHRSLSSTEIYAQYTAKRQYQAFEIMNRSQFIVR